jgi:hypothetical protein
VDELKDYFLTMLGNGLVLTTGDTTGLILFTWWVVDC